MTATCGCGLASERAAEPLRCQECGTTCCRSCRIGVDTITYCRWCASTAAVYGG